MRHCCSSFTPFRTVAYGAEYGTVAALDLAPEQRPASQLLLLAQVLAARRLEASGSLAPMGAESISNASWILGTR